MRLDPELRRYLVFARPENFTALAADLKAHFGLDVEPDVAAHLWRDVRTRQPGKPSRFRADRPVMATIEDHADLQTLDALLEKIAGAFGSYRTPSRSQLGRLVREVRKAGETATLQLKPFGGGRARQ